MKTKWLKKSYQSYLYDPYKIYIIGAKSESEADILARTLKAVQGPELDFFLWNMDRIKIAKSCLFSTEFFSLIDEISDIYDLYGLKSFHLNEE